MRYTEFSAVEAPIISWLQQLGWRYISSEHLVREPEEPFDLETLKAAITRLNPQVVRSDDDVTSVLSRLRAIANDSSGNREFFEWLKGERSIVLRTGEKAHNIRLIDFENLDTNIFVVANQYRFAGYADIRLDIVLIVNGIPLAAIEAKAPARPELDYREGIKQLLRYHEQAPQLFKYLAFVCATEGINFRYDWLTRDKFFEWKVGISGDPVKCSVKALFDRRLFLDFIANFIVFEREREEVRKKLAMYQQVVAANKVLDRVLSGRTLRGLVWHTQGSGKSLTMLFAAWKLKKAPQLQNPTILLVVDRIDLQRQLWDSFTNVDLPYTARAESRRDLMQKLKQDSREVIISTIQKFEDIKGVLSGRKNIIVFVDEAHRSQYGELAIRMRQAFPNAYIFGFTGTPIDKGPLGKSTFRAFCPAKERYLDKYSIKQSIEDGATVRLVYQPRLVEYHVPKEILDREFLSITAPLSEEEQEKVLEKAAKLKTILKAKARIEKVAQDVAQHFRTFIEPNGFKAQFVAVDREACALYKEALDRYLPPDYSTVIYTANANDEPLLRRYHLAKEEQLRITRRPFQKKGELPKILIVTDMLLTGFDAPIEQVMYLDKPLRDHKLLQAIARTNRPYPGKEAGIIIDYVGIFDELEKALNFQEEEIEGVADNYEVLKKEFEQALRPLVAMFRQVPRDGSRASLFKAFDVLQSKDNAERFRDGLSKLKRLYETIAPDPFLGPYIDAYTWLLEIIEAYNKLLQRGQPDLSEYEEKTKQLIREQLLVPRLETTLPIFELNRDYLQRLEQAHYSDSERVMELQRSLEYHIRINLEANPIYETLSQRLERILKAQDRRQRLQELEQLVTEVVSIEEAARKSGLTPEQNALLRVTEKHLPKLSEAERRAFVLAVLEDVRPKLFTGWHRKGNVTREVEQVAFDVGFQRFSKTLKTEALLALTEELMKYIVRYNP